MAETIAYDFKSPTMEGDSSDVSGIIAEAVMRQVKKIGYVNKKILRTAFPFIIKGMSKDDSFLREAMKIDFSLMDHIRDMFDTLERNKRLAEDFKTDVATDIVFSALVYQLMSYVFIDEMTFEKACDNISEGIHFILSDTSR